MAKKKVTSNDVADAAGVSQATVSYVMSGCWDEKGISQSTRDRVVGIAKELGYRSSRLARGLKLGRTHVLGALLPCVTFSYFSEIVRGAEEVASRAGYVLTLMHTDEDVEVERKRLEVLLSYEVDGMLIIPAHVRSHARPLRQLQEDEVPFVLVDKTIPGLHTNFVGTDDREGARQAVEHLISLGHRRIAHIRGPEEASSAQERLRGYQEAMDAASLEIQPSLFGGDGWDESAGREAARRLLSAYPRTTAIFSCTDMAAWGVYDVLREQRTAIPDEMSVVGYADLQESARLSPPLTTVHQPAREVGRRAARLLIDAVENPNPHQHAAVRLPTELVVRGSTGPPTQ
jgi:LacI family transcriptional regulator